MKIAILHIFKVTESKGNVYMYDDNHESSRVTSGITRLQLQFPAGVRKGRIVIQENLPGMHLREKKTYLNRSTAFRQQGVNHIRTSEG